MKKDIFREVGKMIQENTGLNVYSTWAGDVSGGEYICIVYNDRLSIYCDLESMKNNIVKVVSADEIACGEWYDLEPDKYPELEEKLKKDLKIA